jgi:hypothetical protein
VQRLDKNIESARLNFRIDGTSFDLMKKTCEKVGIPISIFIRTSCFYYMQEINKTSKDEDKEDIDKFLEIKKNEFKESQFEKLRSHTAKKITFIANIKRNMFLFLEKGGEKKDLLENLKASENIARLHQWKKQEREIKRMIVMLKKKKCDTLALTREIKKLEGETENGTRPKLLEEKNL